MPDNERHILQQKLEQKRLEHEKQRALQKKAFEEQVRSILPMRFGRFRSSGKAESSTSRRAGDDTETAAK